MEFELFSTAHFAALAVLILVSTVIILFRTRIRKPEFNRKMRYGLAFLLIGCELSLQLFILAEHSWWIGSLPFQLCSLMVIVSAVVMFTNHKGSYDIIFFVGSMGALQALLTPNLDETFPHFRYFQFFIAHISIVAAAIYIIAVERYQPSFRSVLRALLWLHLLAIPAAITNILTGTTNFMFLARKPASASLLDLLAPWPWYLLQLEVVAFGIFIVLYAVLRLLPSSSAASKT